MSKKQALTEFHRGSILAAAERLFAEKGTEKTTMDDIAREAEYSKATLYIYFQSKEEIIGAILLSGMVLLSKRLREVLQSRQDWFQTYDAVCGTIARFYEENPSTYQAAVGQLAVLAVTGTDGGEDSELLRVTREINAELLEFLQRGEKAGIVRAGWPLEEVILLFWSSLSGMVQTAERADHYIEQTFGLDRTGFLMDGTRLLLAAITGSGAAQPD